MSKELKELKAEVSNLKAKVTRLENELNLLYEENITFSDVIADIKQIKQELMDYTNGKIYFENAW
jgi:predicted nuclease with TOPRIM domain